MEHITALRKAANLAHTRYVQACRVEKQAYQTYVADIKSDYREWRWKNAAHDAANAFAAWSSVLDSLNAEGVWV